MANDKVFKPSIECPIININSPEGEETIDVNGEKSPRIQLEPKRTYEFRIECGSEPITIYENEIPIIKEVTGQSFYLCLPDPNANNGIVGKRTFTYKSPRSSGNKIEIFVLQNENVAYPCTSALDVPKSRELEKHDDTSTSPLVRMRRMKRRMRGQTIYPSFSCES